MIGVPVADSFSVAGKVILVTGAATGIGRATSELLASLGARVVGIGLDGKEGSDLADDLSGRGLAFRFRELVVRNDAEVRAAVAEIVATEGRLDGLVNSAAVNIQSNRAEDVSDAEWDLTIAVNLGGTFKVCRAALPAIRQAGGGSVVNIASVHALATVPGMPAYAASKGWRAGGLAAAFARLHGVFHSGECAGRRLRRYAHDPAGRGGRGQRGGPEPVLGAERHRRIADPKEIAMAIAFLLSDAASFVTGSGFVIHGGMTALLF